MKLVESFRNLFKDDAHTEPEATGSCCGHDGVCEQKKQDVGAGPRAQDLEVVVEKGYKPGRLAATAGTPIRVTFLRNETSSCSKEVVFPGLGIRRALPTGERVTIELPAQRPGIVPFTCGMSMMKGAIEIR